MFSRRSREEENPLLETAKYFCLCTPVWECVFEDEFYECLPLYKVREWNNDRKMKRQERIETRNREKAGQRTEKECLERTLTQLLV
mmetsp:Transcript_26040/g.38502  ORF Transcript_26040/g.38502 Transcript_26040/m.38502 type:complete len:86 (+) Transcript_26040:185-442(+)